ncbi:hypothetical protein [Pseudomonas moraviensis]
MQRKILFSVLFMSVNASAAGICSFEEWSEHRGVKLLKEEGGSAYVFSAANIKVDADGAPNAYHPADIGLNCITGSGFKGLDCPANGGYPNSNWWRSAIVPDPQDPKKAYVQPTGNFKGYFVSRTSLQDRSKSDFNTAKYVDSTSIPFLVFPGSFYSKSGTGHLGDLGYAVNVESGKGSAFIVAEIGPSDAHLGEMSIFLGRALGGTDPNPRTGTGVPKGRIAYIVFPSSKSTPSWPLTLNEMEDRVSVLLKAVGGAQQLRECSGYP